MRSPCVGGCKLVNNLCRGCWRTKEEITLWYKLEGIKKKQMWGELILRKKEQE
tara:strand:- start:3440 stop:3598 length:159 start_codon:yes stop_codon:yes gene_type:complete